MVLNLSAVRSRFSRFLPLLLLLISPLLAAGCTEGGEGREPLREHLESGGTRLTHTEIDLQFLTFDLVAEWDIWSTEAPYLFSDVTDVVGGDDTFFLLDGGNHEVVEFTADGALRNTFGREGSGPGEFRYPLQMTIHGGRLWISDVGNVRFSVYTIDGSSQDDVRWPGGSRLVNSFAITPRGGILHGGIWPLTVAELAEQDPMYYLAEFAGEGLWEEGSSVHVDTLAVMRAEPWSGFVIRSEEGGERGWFESPVFSPQFYWSASNDLIVTVTSADYRFEVRDMQGTILLEIVCPTPDLRVTEAHRRWYFDSFAREAIPGLEPFTLTSDSKARFVFARELQAIAGISIDGAGNIYVLANSPVPGTTRLDLFSAEGIYRGSVSDAGLPEACIGDGTILLKSTDSAGLDRFRTGIIR
ncbi:hypothetical protein ACFL6T_01815 [Candidatus Zixiibacteriota bacterium]